MLRLACIGGRGDLPPTVVVKVHLRGETWRSDVREAAALDLLTRAAPGHAPGLLCVAENPSLVVLHDLGRGRRDLASVLLGRDPETARAGVLAWAAAIGRLHAATHGWDAMLTDALSMHAARLVSPTPTTDDMPGALQRAAEVWRTQLPRVGVFLSEAAEAELAGLDALLVHGRGSRALTPADACPDNNMFRDGRVILLDFEGAQVRHVAWDVAYLRVPWPSCWCCWALPASLASEAVAAWQTAAAPDLPYAVSDEFEADLRIAMAGWTVISVGWFLPGLLDGDPHQHDRRTPDRRDVLIHRLTALTASEDPRLSRVCELALAVLTAVRREWGARTLPLAPALRHRG